MDVCIFKLVVGHLLRLKRKGTTTTAKHSCSFRPKHLTRTTGGRYGGKLVVLCYVRRNSGVCHTVLVCWCCARWHYERVHTRLFALMTVYANGFAGQPIGTVRPTIRYFCIALKPKNDRTPPFRSVVSVSILLDTFGTVNTHISLLFLFQYTICNIQFC